MDDDNKPVKEERINENVKKVTFKDGLKVAINDLVPVRYADGTLRLVHKRVVHAVDPTAIDFPKENREQFKARRIAEAKQQLDEAGLAYKTSNDDTHFQVQTNVGVFDLWPTTYKFRQRAPGRKATGGNAKSLIRTVKQIEQRKKR
jgi:hypothetical protein